MEFVEIATLEPATDGPTLHPQLAKLLPPHHTVLPAGQLANGEIPMPSRQLDTYVVLNCRVD